MQLDAYFARRKQILVDFTSVMSRDERRKVRWSTDRQVRSCLALTACSIALGVIQSEVAMSDDAYLRWLPFAHAFHMNSQSAHTVAQLVL